jgi:exodeoxyribonuclease VII large subunit
VRDERQVRQVSLVRLSALVAQAATALGAFAVEGEVHRVQRGRTGWLRFTLRDRASQITVAVPKSRLGRCRAVDGERVSVVGRLEWVNDWGQLQFLADEVTPVGAGAIAAAIAEARRRLDTDGILARARRRIPVLPRAIGVVCGHEAAVRADIESVVAARFPGYPVVFCETTVSGPGAVDRITEGLAELCARPEIDVVILARGGGDATQLLPFSDESLCRAVAAARVPVVAAIGHDGDRPLVDEVADLRCGTPSLAAGAVIPDEKVLRAGLESRLTAAAAAAERRVELCERRLSVVDRTTAARGCGPRFAATRGGS